MMRGTSRRLQVFWFTLSLFFATGVSLLFAQSASSPVMKVHFINVGQGDAILIQFPSEGQEMLVDTGVSSKSKDLVKYLQKQNIQAPIEYLAITHPDSDHIGGLAAVMKAFPIGTILDCPNDKQFNGEVCTRIGSTIPLVAPAIGTTYTLGKATVTVLGPTITYDKPRSAMSSDEKNNCSLVLLVTYGSRKFLLTGDMQDDARAKGYPWPSCDVLKVSHHGADNGTDEKFVRETSPTAAVIMCGLTNRYKHPRADAMRALVKYVPRIYCTALHKDIVIQTDGQWIKYPKYESMPVVTGTASGTFYYIGDVNQRIFHQPGCAVLHSAVFKTYFCTFTEAGARSFHPCTTCTPEELRIVN